MKTYLRRTRSALKNKGIALVMVLSLLAMLVMLVVAMLTLSQGELSSSNQYSKQEVGRELADVAVNVVMGQIREATAQRQGQTRTFWASQPGAIRQYEMNGNFRRGYRLYSSPKMEVIGAEIEMLSDATPTDWQNYPATYVDLNEPVIRPGQLNGAPLAYFPIIDPRAYVQSRDALSFDANTGDASAAADNPNVEGFWYNADAVKGATKATDPLIDPGARLPMPVEWLYVRQDGSFCTLPPNSGSNAEFVKADGSALQEDDAKSNPIVARIAFWTDDETSKVNVNTASEPTLWATPHLVHNRDLSWAHSQPTAFEYQRYPGHPATVALSTVLFPNTPMDGYFATGAERANILQRKESIYQMMPKINRGGSISGTIPVWKLVDDETGYQDANYFNKSVDLSQSVKERLFASVDEMLFSEFNQSQDQRGLARLVNPSDGSMTGSDFFAQPQQLERLRFFLTAQSRAPDTTLYGTPRVSIWPVSDEGRTGESASNPTVYRTGFDNMIAYASSLRPMGASGGQNHSYFFRRANSNRWFNNQSLQQDVDLQRNKSLLNYLKGLMSATYPGGGSFASKFQADADQLLIEIFDYIRMTNTYDNFLSPTHEVIEDGATSNPYRTDGTVYRDVMGAPGGGANGSTADEIYKNFQQRSPTRMFKTYTPDRASRNITTTDQADTVAGVPRNSKSEIEADLSFPGHGQVVPSEWNGNQGIGRFLTLTEVGFHFICTGDGANDKGSYRPLIPNPAFDGGQPESPTNPKWIEDTAATLKYSGGRTAPRIDEHSGDGRGRADPMMNQDPFTFQQKRQVWYSNYPPNPGVQLLAKWGLSTSFPLGDPRNPRTTIPGRNQPYHPGLNPLNWNATLDFNPRTGGVALEPNQKRVQGMFVMEWTLVSPGYPQINPDFTVVVRGLGGTSLDGNSLYSNTGSNMIVWKSGQRFMDQDSSRGLGGSVNAFGMYNGRRTKSTIPGIFDDPNYDSAASGGQGGPHDGLLNFDLTTKFVTINGTTMNFGGSAITIEVYASHEISQANLVQTYSVTIPSRRLPAPQLVTMTSDHQQWVDNDNNISQQLATHAPRWWAFNYFGALGRFGVGPNGGFVQLTGNNDQDPVLRRQLGGRFFDLGSTNDRVSIANSNQYGSVPLGRTSVYAFDASSGNFNNPLINPVTPGADNSADAFADTQPIDLSAGPGSTPTQRGSDVVFTMVPRHGDFRLLAAKKEVPDSEWMIHPDAQNLGSSGKMVAHNLARYNTQSEAGFARDSAPFANRLVYGANYAEGKIPDLPPTVPATQDARKYGDFDNAVGDVRDGPWINKPDEGNATLLFRWRDSQVARWVNAYIGGYDEWIAGDPGETLMTPNRMICSPVTFGSLPTGVKRGLPWQTLLFRPHTRPFQGGLAAHPGSPAYFGGQSPADHYILDLFTMPVVEPYAISENFSTAGKINMNYQIVPFGRSRPSATSAGSPNNTNPYIRRATALHALMKGELLSAVPHGAANKYKGGYPSGALQERDNYVYRQPWTDTSNAGSFGGLQRWHRRIEVERRNATGTVQGTLLQFEDRFNFKQTAWSPAGAQGLFRAPSQICEIHLVPRKLNGSANTDGGDGNVGTPYSPADMATFWGANGSTGRGLTGDNLREKPYANLHARLTTQSNTYRVHFRAQMISKARSSKANSFDAAKDTVVSDYRGSALIERRLEVANSTIPDYGASTSPTGEQSLENFYRMRVLELKRFVP